jgi:hypothetical protein
VHLVADGEETRADCLQATLRRTVTLGGVIDYWAESGTVMLRARTLASDAVFQYLDAHVDRMISLRLSPPIAHPIGNRDSKVQPAIATDTERVAT